MGGRIFHQTHWLPLLEIQGSISEVKLELRHQDGSTLPMVVNAILREENGVMLQDIAAFVARDRDAYERELVRSRKRLEELVAESNRMHEEARDRALFAEQMIGIVSHDLRNPVSTVQTGAAILDRKIADEDQRRVVARIARASQRANRLITDLLDFTQARLGGGLRASLKPIDLHATVREAVEELALAHPGRQIRQETSGEGTCQADSNRLVQLVGNLVSNAVTYGAVDQPITITSAVEVASFSIRVHNFGPAISAEALPSLFEPMSRATHETSAQRSVGLGLFIVRQIAASHRGTAQVESNATDGTTFRVQFPR
jgi:sigma-B regulation protein RsbU (phosphoserine phosphatase)